MDSPVENIRGNDAENLMDNPADNPQKNQFARTSILRLRAKKAGDKTVLKDVYFTAPFKIMQPFEGENGACQVMLLSASAGIMAGDTQEFVMDVERGAKLEFISQSYEKIHRMKEGRAERTAHITVAPDAVLKYNPLPVIPFRDSSFISKMEVELFDDTSRFILCELLSCGRGAAGERFSYRSYRSSVKIRRKGKLIYYDNTCYEPDKYEMEGIGMFEGFSHLSNLVFCGVQAEEERMMKVRALMDGEPGIEGGITRTGSGDIAVKILGNGAQKLLEVMEKIERTYIIRK